MTRLTIAIPNYNGGENLKRAIISCQNITIPIQEYEIIVVDNCSTDNSRNIVNELKIYKCKRSKNEIIALSIIIENGGTGGSTAAPIAAELTKLYFGLGDHTITADP